MVPPLTAWGLVSLGLYFNTHQNHTASGFLSSEFWPGPGLCVTKVSLPLLSRNTGESQRREERVAVVPSFRGFFRSRLVALEPVVQQGIMVRVCGRGSPHLMVAKKGTKRQKRPKSHNPFQATPQWPHFLPLDPHPLKAPPPPNSTAGWGYRTSEETCAAGPGSHAENHSGLRSPD
jgi:hypothetical protein